MTTEVRDLLRSPLFIATTLVGVAVLLFFLWKAPERPTPPTLAAPQATQFPTRTPGPSPTFGPRPTPGPPTATSTPDNTAIVRDEQRRRDLPVIASIIAEYAREEGAVPITGPNAQSLCVYDNIDAGCELRDFADGRLPASPPGTPYGYFSEDGRAWLVFAELESVLVSDAPCAHERAKTMPHPERTICASGNLEAIE